MLWEILRDRYDKMCYRILLSDKFSSHNRPIDKKLVRNQEYQKYHTLKQEEVHSNCELVEGYNCSIL